MPDFSSIMALFEFGMVALFLLVVAVVILAALFFWGLKHAIVLALNSIIGFFALYAVKAFFLQDLVLNFWSVILVAIFGIFGFIIVLLLHFLGFWF